MRQSRPDSGLSFQVAGRQNIQVVPSSLRIGYLGVDYITQNWVLAFQYTQNRIFAFPSSHGSGLVCSCETHELNDQSLLYSMTPSTPNPKPQNLDPKLQSLKPNIPKLSRPTTLNSQAQNQSLNPKPDPVTPLSCYTLNPEHVSFESSSPP